MSAPIIDLQKLSGVISNYEKYGTAAGVAGVQISDVLAGQLGDTRNSVVDAARALLSMYDDFPADAVNAAIQTAITGKTINSVMQKVIAATHV